MIRRGVTEIGGRFVDEARLVAGQLEVSVLSFGAITRMIRFRGRPLILGYDAPAAYGADPYFMGVIAGRVANRIAGGRFSLAGRDVILPRNDGAHHLHGGPEGFGKRHWRMEAMDTTTLRLRLDSPDGDGGYPGALWAEVLISVTPEAITYDMRAEVDRPTPVNLAQHNYYLGFPGTLLQIAAAYYLPTDDAGIPTGEISAVAGTRQDFRTARAVTEAVDHCLVLDGTEPVAILTHAGGPELRFFTDQPGLQVYTGAHLGVPFVPFSALCLEPEGFPDAVNRPEFPSILASPERPYRQLLRIEVT